MSTHEFPLRLLSFALTLATLGATSQSLAQSSSAASDASQSEELLERGVELRRTSQDTQALVLFRQALDLDPQSSRAQAHLGTTYQALGRWVLAETYLARALEHSDDSYVERHRAALEQAQEFVKDHLGLLEVQGNPPGAEIRLNGQRLGTLPMSEPAHVPVGSYQMEVSLAGHYGSSEPIHISRRALTREAVELLPLSAGARSAGTRSAATPNLGPAGTADAVSGSGSVAREASSVPAWLPWTLAGVSAGAAGLATAAWIQRENHANRWQDDGQCLNVPGATRQSLCGAERTRGLRAQTVALVSGGAAMAFAIAAVWTALADGADSPTSELAGLESCGIGLAGASCFGRF
ncbi:MAG: tetratricopeptide repeat protein [Deltaproteobacteria bacterium]